MTLATDHVADFGDGTYRFALRVAQLEELDDKTGVGPVAMLERLTADTWRLADVRDTIRLGLVGGGTDGAKALLLVRRYVDAVPLEQSVPLAAAILLAAVRGRVDAAGNAVAAKSPTDPAAPTGSTSPPSAAMPASSASHPGSLPA